MTDITERRDVLIVGVDDAGLARILFCKDTEADLLEAVAVEVFGSSDSLTPEERGEVAEVLSVLVDTGSWYPEGDPPLHLFKLAQAYESHRASPNPAPVAGDWVMVPRVATDLMRSRARSCNAVLGDEVTAIWNAMLAAAPSPESAWKDAAMDALTINFILEKEHEDNPRKAIADLVAWERKVALDPAVSSEAQALIDRGKSAPASAGLVEGLRELRQWVNTNSGDGAHDAAKELGTRTIDRIDAILARNGHEQE